MPTLERQPLSIGGMAERARCQICSPNAGSKALSLWVENSSLLYLSLEEALVSLRCFLSPHLLLFDERQFKPHADSQVFGAKVLLSTESPVKASACGDGRR